MKEVIQKIKFLFSVVPVNGSFGMDGEKMMADQAKHSFHDLPFWSAESRKMMAMFGEMYRSCKGKCSGYFSLSALVISLEKWFMSAYWNSSKLDLQYSWRTRNSSRISKKANTILRLPISTTTALLASFTRPVSLSLSSLFELTINYPKCHWYFEFQRFQHGSGSVPVLWLTTLLMQWASLSRHPIALVSLSVFWYWYLAFRQETQSMITCTMVSFQQWWWMREIIWASSRESNRSPGTLCSV